MPYALTNNKISLTYGRLVQRVSGSYYDGLGNLITFGGGLSTGSTYPFTSSWSNNSVTASYVESASYSLNSLSSSHSEYSDDADKLDGQHGSYYQKALVTGSTYPITASWANKVISSSYSDNSNKLDGQHGSYYQKALVTGSTYPITASWSNKTLSSSYASYSANASSSIYTQDVIVYVKNGSGAIIPKGKVVRIVGADNSANSPSVGLADWANDANSANTLGFTMQSLAIGGFGYVITEGKLLNVNTQAFLPGDLLYLSSSGTYTNVTPIAPKHGVRLGEVIRSQLNNGSIYVRIDNGSELGELHDVVDNTTTASYGDLLMKSGSVWKNSRNLTGSYYLEGTFVLTHVSQSLNFASDAAAGIGGVPLGGLYRSGSFVKIRMI